MPSLQPAPIRAAARFNKRKTEAEKNGGAEAPPPDFDAWVRD